jgi:hypothetical protein
MGIVTYAQVHWLKSTAIIGLGRLMTDFHRGGANSAGAVVDTASARQ